MEPIWGCDIIGTYDIPGDVDAYGYTSGGIKYVCKTTKINNFKDQIKLFDLVSSITSLIYFVPVFIILFFSQEIIVLVYGEKWLPSSILLQVFSVVVLFKAVSSNVGPLLHAHSNTKVDMEVAILNPLIYDGSRQYKYFFSLYHLVYYYQVTFVCYYI